MSTLADLPYAAAEKCGGVSVQEMQSGSASLAMLGRTQNWEEIQTAIAARSRWLFALGFDGILSPTVLRPNEAIMPDKTRLLLAELDASPRVTLAFLSGRSIRDIQTRVGFQDAFYVGNHGMEIRGPGYISSDGLAVSCRADLVDALVCLAKCTKRLRGVFIEDKGMTVTVHSRSVAPGDSSTLRELMGVIVRNHPRLRACAGEACWDLRARASWNKADAVRQILGHLRLAPGDAIYVGEEFTDEDAFAQIPKALTFCVGRRETTAARYCLPNQAAVAELLSNLLHAVEGMSPI